MLSSTQVQSFKSSHIADPNMASSEGRKYDIVLLGATGYTGKNCAEHITTHFPTNLKWALSGRSHERLSAIVEEIKAHNPDRLQPAIETVKMSLDELGGLAKKTCLILNTVGPYYRYSTPVVQACAENGTHYLDVTGESPWVFELIQKFHDAAKARNAIIIPEVGVESAPSDLVAWSLAGVIREKLSVGTKEVISCVHDMKAQPSGGTLATVTGILDHYSLREVAKASAPWAMSPIPGPGREHPASLITKMLGIRKDQHLGTLTTSVAGGPNTAIVHRTWGLLGGPKGYGPKFQYNEYMSVRNSFVGAVVHIALMVGLFALAIPPVRWLIQMAAHNIYAPGQGAEKEVTKNERLEIRAIAEADQDIPNPQLAMAKFCFNGSLYSLTGILLAEAAMVILEDDSLAERLGGGILTPAMLGKPFVDRLRKVGVLLESRIMPEK